MKTNMTVETSSARSPRSMRIAILLLLACLVGESYSQRYFFENIGIQDGLPASKVYAALQSGFGIVWIGTEAGLASYDGNLVVNHEQGVARSGARALHMDREAGLWSGIWMAASPCLKAITSGHSRWKGE